MKQIIVAIMLLSFSVAALALSPDVLWTASDPQQLNNTARTGVPPVVQLELNDSGEMLLSWAEITGATGYKVYRADAPEPIGSDAWTVLGELPPETLSYIVAPAQTRGFFYVTSTQDDGPDMPDNFIFVAGGTVAGITVSDFYMDKFQVTQEEYLGVMLTNPSHFSGDPNLPVEKVSWFNAIEYCNRRSMGEGLTPCYSYTVFGTDPDNWPSDWDIYGWHNAYVNCDFSAIGYRLPRESEWEYAARGGLETHGYTYSGSNTLDEVGWYDLNSNLTTHAVGGKLANELGLYDMSGNLWEWCWDIDSGSYVIVRGGSYHSHERFSAVSYQYDASATQIYPHNGFRLCRSTP